MLRRIELLVHAGAPSTRSDDARYTAQANAYLDFAGQIVGQPGSTTTEPAPLPTTESEHPITDAEQQGEAKQGYDASTFLEDTQSAWIALESQLDASSCLRQSVSDDTAGPADYQRPAEAVADPGPQRFHTARQDFSAVSTSNEHLKLKRARDETPENDRNHVNNALNVTTNDINEATTSTRSSYLRSPVLDRSVKRARIAPNDVRHNRYHIASAAPATAAQQNGLKERINTETVRSGGSTEGDQNTSELPTSYSLSNITSGSSRARTGISQRSTSDPGPQIGSISPTALRAVPDSEQLAPPLRRSSSEPSRLAATKGALKRILPSRADHVAGGVHLIPVTRDAGDNSRASANARGPDTVPSAVQEAYAALSTEIHPPPPDVGLNVFTTHITPALDILAKYPDLAECYKPLSTSRDLQQLERGYWLIRTPRTNQDWTDERQLEFWGLLEKYIGSGKAGWGVWCTREQDTGDRSSLGILKVYCWGEVVKHLYHLLYISSKSQVRRMGLQWVGGDGEVVVQMKNV